VSSINSIVTTARRNIRLPPYCFANPLPTGSLVRRFLVLSLVVLAHGCATIAPNDYKLFRQSVRANPDDAVLIEKIPKYMGQKISEDAACLYGATRFWKRRISAPDLIRWIDQYAARLSPPDIYLQFAWRQGLYATASHLSPQILRERIKNGIPVIVLLQENALYPSTRRYALILGYNNITEQILLRYGNHRDTAMSYDQFQREWRVSRNWMLVICPPDYPSWELNGQELADRARFHEINQQYDRAARDYQAAITAGFGQSDVLLRLGNTQRKLGQIDKAEVMYRRAITADPQNGQAYNNLAYLLTENNRNLEEAESLARQALILDPMNPFSIDTLGFVLSAQGRFQKASDVLERARARAKWFPAKVRAEIAVHLAMAHYRNRQEHLAREVAIDAQHIYPKVEIPEELRKLIR